MKKGLFAAITFMLLLVILKFSMTSDIIIQTQNIKKIFATSQMEEKVISIEVPTDYQKPLLKSLNKIRKSRVKIAPVGGWDYYFRIEYNDRTVVNISISEGLMHINGKYFIIRDYRSENFNFLFEESVPK